MKKRFLGGAAARRARRNANMCERELALMPLLLSGKDEAGLCAQAQRLREHLLAHPQLEILDVAPRTRQRRGARDRVGLLLGRLQRGYGGHPARDRPATPSNADCAPSRATSVANRGPATPSSRLCCAWTSSV
jgi:hypothetical protein